MTGLASRPGLAPAATGLAIALHAAVAWLVLRADEARVYVLGRPIGWVCGLRSRLGLPCPTCGMTRSVVLSLHGEVGRAWHVAPAGPVALFGLLALAGAVLAVAGNPEIGSESHVMEPARRSGLCRGYGHGMVGWLVGKLFGGLARTVTAGGGGGWNLPRSNSDVRVEKEVVYGVLRELWRSGGRKVLCEMWYAHGCGRSAARRHVRPGCHGDDG